MDKYTEEKVLQILKTEKGWNQLDSLTGTAEKLVRDAIEVHSIVIQVASPKLQRQVNSFFWGLGVGVVSVIGAIIISSIYGYGYCQ